MQSSVLCDVKRVPRHVSASGSRGIIHKHYRVVGRVDERDLDLRCVIDREGKLGLEIKAETDPDAIFSTLQRRRSREPRGGLRLRESVSVCNCAVD